MNKKKKKIAWIVGNLEELGGGERLLLEGERFFSLNNFYVKIITWRFNKKALFENRYRPSDIEVLSNVKKKVERSKILLTIYSKIKTFKKLYKILKEYNPDILVCQNEYDMIITGFMGLILKKKFIVIIFGQTYQFPYDNIKYSKVYKKHLIKIINSCQGYKDSIPLTPPKLSFIDWILNNLLAYLRYFFIRRASNSFALSNQLIWEIETIFNIKPSLFCPGVSKKKLIDRKNKAISKKINSKKIKFIMINRLVKKKRVDLAIKSFKNINYNFELNVVGIGPEYNLLNDLITKNNLQDKIFLRGSLTDNKLNNLIQNSDVFLNLDTADFNITVYEAMSFGLHLILTTDYSLDNNIENYGKISVIKPFVHDLTSNLKKINSNKNNEKINYEVINNYTWENNFEKIKKFI